MNEPTHGRTDTPSYRDGRTHLKIDGQMHGYLASITWGHDELTTWGKIPPEPQPALCHPPYLPTYPSKPCPPPAVSYLFKSPSLSISNCDVSRIFLLKASYTLTGTHPQWESSALHLFFCSLRSCNSATSTCIYHPILFSSRYRDLSPDAKTEMMYDTGAWKCF